MNIDEINNIRIYSIVFKGDYMSATKEENVNQKRNPHNIILENRSSMMISGVEDVDSFDDQTIVVYTGIGELTIKGEKLHVNKLSLESGELNLSGNIFSMVYSEVDSKNTSFFSKLFK